MGDWAITAAGAAVTLDGDRIATARIGLTAVNADAAELAAVGQALAGRPASDEVLADAGQSAAEACEPATDMRGSSEYKRHLAKELAIRTLRTAIQRVRDAS
jgi:carbon-monoxide dehydrogenase medium subunit